jgi:hypothetical protein
MRLKYQWIVITAIFSFFYFLLGWFLIQTGRYENYESLFLIEKARLGLFGKPPRLENVGLVYPPLPFLLLMPMVGQTWLLGPILLSSVLGGLTAAWCGWILWRTPGSNLLKWLLLISLLLNPICLLIYSGGSSLALAPLLLAMIFFLLTRFLQERNLFFRLHEQAFEKADLQLVSERYARWRLHYLWGAALCLGLLFFVRYESVWMFFILCPLAIYFSSDPTHRGFSQTFAIQLLLFIPMGASLLIWFYLNWVFTGDPLHFIHSPYSFFLGIELQAGLQKELMVFRESFFRSLLEVFKIALLVSPLYFIFLGYVPGTVLKILSLTPVLGLAIALYTGTTNFPVESFGMMIPLTIVVYTCLGLERPLTLKTERILAFLLLILLPSSWLVLTHSRVHQESRFANALLGERSTSSLTSEKAVAQFLQKTVDPTHELILMDDSHGYPIVSYYGDPKPFLLPYSSAFRPAVNFPSYFTTYVVVPDPSHFYGSRDAINLLHPNLYQQGSPELQCIQTIGSWKIFKTRRISKDLLK